VSDVSWVRTCGMMAQRSIRRSKACFTRFARSDAPLQAKRASVRVCEANCQHVYRSGSTSHQSDPHGYKAGMRHQTPANAMKPAVIGQANQKRSSPKLWMLMQVHNLKVEPPITSGFFFSDRRGRSGPLLLVQTAPCRAEAVQSHTMCISRIYGIQKVTSH